jgi:NAD(P)H-hydrate epimerase
VAGGDWASAIDAVNAALVPVVAVDIPSGVDGTSAAVAGPAVRADLMVTFGAAKTGEVLLPGAELAGDLRVVDIGFPEELIPDGIGLTEPGDVLAVVPERAVDAHKKASGTLVVVAGSRRMTGAAKLIAHAAARIGAGYVFVAAPASVLAVIQSDLTEAVFVPLPETDAGSVAADALEIVRRVADGADSLALGPGLSTEPETQAFIRALVRECPVPFVLDADGLNAFAGEAAAIADRKAEAVMTPHLGELARLTGPNDDRLVAARDLARRADAVALVKGSRTVVARPDGAARVNPTGTAVLATAGTGDVLTGVIGGLLARGVEPFDAAWAGAYLHGAAGLVAGQATADGTVAGDVASRLPDALELVRRQAGGQG